MDSFALSYTDEPVLYSGIPNAIIGPYFPRHTLSITEFLQFKLPSLQTNLQSTSTCLSNHPPSIPELAETKIGIHYVPISIIRIWEVLFQIQNIQKMWKESETQVEKLASCYPTHRIAIKAAQKQLLSCEWNTKILGFSKSILGSIKGLIHHLTLSCLVTTDISYHVELLERDLEAHGISARLLSPIDVQYLTGCATQPDGNGHERFGSELSSGTIPQFGGITHINNNHWVAFLISTTEATIFLVDSLHGVDGPSVAATEVIHVLQWWLSTSYLELNQSAPPFQVAWLPVAYQNDATSCSFFALNALMHHFIPKKYPLATGKDVVMLCVKFLTSILNHHDAQMNPTPEAIVIAALVVATSAVITGPTMSDPGIAEPVPMTFSSLVATSAATIPVAETGQPMILDHTKIQMETLTVLPTVAEPAHPINQETSRAMVGISVGSDVGKSKGKKLKLDFTVTKGDEGHGLLQFFHRVNHKEFVKQRSIEFEKITERCEEARAVGQLAARLKLERSRALAWERQQRHQAMLAAGRKDTKKKVKSIQQNSCEL
ncbi:uncharacterized protein EI90DRAFT_3022271 [Cantharellus anzutake]|uniref:uncharacterized protein n=1 Tax=Cantharellus anzutake TaxID=1750568 RepID=UPI0019038672|nr:uncharacterized protein EI90DRAFT_3022271 [Cantharellus anzutake]KAF8314562.1 hypothetical protein EI90DRAFT_3022271 [Cantharellus anzutake]